MSTTIILLLIITLSVLILGVVLMARGGRLNRKMSNKLMIARVVFQALTILLVGIFYYFSHKQ